MQDIFYCNRSSGGVMTSRKTKCLVSYTINARTHVFPKFTVSELPYDASTECLLHTKGKTVWTYLNPLVVMSISLEDVFPLQMLSNMDVQIGDVAIGIDR